MTDEHYGRTVRTIEVLRSLDPSRIAAIDRLLADVEGADGHQPMSDQHRLDLAAGGGEGFAAVVASDDGRPIGYAQVSHGNCSSTVELVVDPVRSGGTDVPRSRRSWRRPSTSSAGPAAGSVHWWVFDPSADDDELAGRLGLTLGRELLQMRRALPTDLPYTVTTRPFVPGADDAAWVEVNNRAFADHPEQGGWTVDTLRLRQRESWFDPEGFLLHERDGRLAGFCWTKLHVHDDPPLGEIYVIGVDPDFQGLGLGRQLTLAGLDSIAAARRRHRHAVRRCRQRRGARDVRAARVHRPSHRPRLHRDAVSATATAPTRYDATREDIAELLADEPEYRIEQVWRGLYGRLAGPEEMTDLPTRVREALAIAPPAALRLRTESVSDRGDTVKFLWELAGAARVETVLMLYPDRATVCVSSQAGCAMGCGFCATGQAGFSRHLTTGEIVEQVVRAARRARDRWPAASATSCSWGWASRSPTRPRCGLRSSGCTGRWACRLGTSRSRRWASSPASAGSPSESCPSPWR